MILQALAESYQRFVKDPEYEVAVRGFSFQKISFAVVLEEDGRLFEIQDIRVSLERKKIPKRMRVLGMNKPTGSALSPCFLWDNTAYLLGLAKEEGKKKRALEAFRETKRRYKEVEEEIGDKGFSAVCRFLENWLPDQVEKSYLNEDLWDTFGIFQIRGTTAYLHESPRIIEWWLARTEGDEEKMKKWWETAPSDGPDPKGWCLISGVYGPLARLHEPKVKGVLGQQPTGAVLAGSNQDAFDSYGWEQAYNAPATKEAVFAYLTALNTMLDGPKRNRHRLVMGNTTILFWTERPTVTEDIFARFAVRGAWVLEEDVQDEVLLKKIQAFFRALSLGREAYGDLDEDPERTRYFIFGLSAPTPARIAVRFFHQSTLDDLLTKLRQHFMDLKLDSELSEGRKGWQDEYPSIRQILDETCPRRDGKPDRDAGPSQLEGPLLEAVITGKRYPEALYHAVIRRLRTEKVNFMKACIIKAYLIRNQRKEVSMCLDEKGKEPAYRLGRLFAALEKTQMDALGNLNATIRDRFYGSASATPRAVFPRLLRTYQYHLSKLEGGRKVNREKLVQEILDPLTDFPAHLNLAEQGLFALGYYHQMRSFFMKKDEETTISEN